MIQHLPELFHMFYPLHQADREHWAAVLSLPDDRVSGPGSECEEE